jgi:hypothetical protein
MASLNKDKFYVVDLGDDILGRLPTAPFRLASWRPLGEDRAPAKMLTAGGLPNAALEVYAGAAGVTYFKTHWHSYHPRDSLRYWYSRLTTEPWRRPQSENDA